MKTYQQKLEDIREDCIAINPEIEELKFGCNISHKVLKEEGDTVNADGVYISLSNGLHWYLANGNIFPILEAHTEIIGRPINILDCRNIIYHKLWHTLIDIWTDGNLDDQPEMVVNWIYENKNNHEHN